MSSWRFRPVKPRLRNQAQSFGNPALAQIPKGARIDNVIALFAETADESLIALYEKDLISKREFEEVEEQYKFYLTTKELTYASYRADSTSRIRQLQELNASEDRMRQNLEGVNRILDNLVIRAPIDGQLATPDHETARCSP